MVKAWSIIIAIVLYCAILGDGANVIGMIPSSMYPKLKEICKPEAMKVFTDCLKKGGIDAGLVDRLQKTLMDIKICDVMPDPCKKDIFKAAMKKIAEEHSDLEKEFSGLATHYKVLKDCLPNITCPK